jgi:hypothetical protein
LETRASSTFEIFFQIEYSRLLIDCFLFLNREPEVVAAINWILDNPFGKEFVKPEIIQFSTWSCMETII